MKTLVITGPTAAGKTAVALALADALPVHLISADSAMVYRQMDIGTAKPDAQTLERYPHALVDIRDPAEPYTVSEFVADADREVAVALERGALPVLVGGSMMYLKAFREGLDDLPTSTPEVREAVAERARKAGWEALHKELTAIDQEAAAKIHPNNPQRLARALEVHAMTGRPISSFWGSAEGAETRTGTELIEVLVDVPSREILHERIAQRLEEMLREGFVDEVARLRARPDLHVDLPSMRAVGYRQVWTHLDGGTDFSTMCEQVLAATRGLARKQYTWLRRWPGLQRLDAEDSDTLARLILG